MCERRQHCKSSDRKYTQVDGSLIPALLQVAKESNAWEQSSQPLHQVFQTVINAMIKETSWGYLALL